MTEAPEVLLGQGKTAGEVCRKLGVTERIPDDKLRLVEDILRLASQYGRYDCRQVTALFGREGWRVNHKRVELRFRERQDERRLRIPSTPVRCSQKRPQTPHPLTSFLEIG